jgi:2-polyprenyl-3-methyl-5-hydroxy-6-metoxy-1,4-benzoquinol methylase
MLASYARHDYSAVPTALGLDGNERVVDAGGGMGVLAHLLLDAHAGLKVTVLDRPEVLERASATPRAGLSWQAGDLFSPWGIEGDAVVLARVLHDWPDPEAGLILHHAREALPAGGRLFIVEMVLPEAGFAGSLCDLHLLMATGGQERTEDAYRRLMDEAGFTLNELRRIPALPSILVGVAR